MRKCFSSALVLSFLALIVLAGLVRAQNTIPELRKGEGGATQLFVDGRPFLMISGELHNSTSSSLEYLRSVWPALKSLRLNSVIASLGWEQFEPVEGQYDFTLIDGLIREAAAQNLKVALLWFASWKNGLSSYTPLWVKKDLKRFFRVKDHNGNNLGNLSPLCREGMQADAKAFAALMRRIKEVDKDQTVIAVQISNEVGIKLDIDHNKESLDLFAGQVPPALTDYLSRHKTGLDIELKTVWALQGYRTKGTWIEVFGDNPSAKEFFMAWQYASYLGEIARQGKKEYALPMFVNAALVHYLNELPGLYLNGGPVSRVMDIYKAAAPAIDLCAPDIYLPAYKSTCAMYTRPDNPLFIPECTDDPGKAFYAFAEHDAVCFAPFGIEDAVANPSFAPAYGVLNELAPQILKYQGTGRMRGFLREGGEPSAELTMGNYVFTITYEDKENPSYGLIIRTGDDDFIFSGMNCRVVLSAVDKKLKGALAQVWEGRFEGERWIPGRLLNGDQSSQNRALLVEGRNPGPLKGNAPVVYKVTAYRHEIEGTPRVR